MKIRNDFVSNSSSSSFIVIADTVGNTEDLSKLNDDLDEFIVPNVEHGKYQFGWEEEITIDFFSKLNFCAMQCFYSDAHCDEWFDMLKNVVKDNYKLNIKMIKPIYYDEEKKYKDLPSYMYIDHQSASSEGQNIDMFTNEDTLLRFLSNTDSYIQGGNDNN